MPSQDMRGLTQYIADLRACRVRELEEKRINKEMAHIRQKFKDGNLDGRQKKKYLSKIVFTYILGYQVDVGHMEAVNLISSPKYSEKQIGYLALTLLMHENSDLVRLVVNSVRKDLDEMNETNNCLALHAIANIGGAEMAEALAGDVHRLLISPTSRSFVKKKAALTLLRLYRKHAEVIPAAEWALRIISIMDDQNLGVALAVTSLVMTLAQDNLEAFAVCYQKAVDRLSKIVIEEQFSADYVYYKVPIPWLQVKLLRLLQYYPPSEDPTLRLVLHNVLDKILKNSQESHRNVQHNNAQNAVLFEAINLAIHLDTESTIVHAAASLLGNFILSKETNVRYLGLDTMAHLAARSDSLEAIKMHQKTIILSLRDKDISVRRRGLDLLYSMCDVTNSKEIVGELLKYLQVADYTLREEMVLKIAILTEKFAVEYEWYVDTILRLMSSAGDHVGEEVWYRVVQIVTNTEELQEYAARRVFEFLGNPACHENIVKVGAYVLGEYGHLIADDAGRSPIEQFQILHSRSNLCSTATKALLLTTYFKWLNLFPEIREQIVSVFVRYSHVLDAELQQRACEYLAIARRPDDDLLQVVVDEMPPYPERESALLSRLLKKTGDTGDKRTWHIGGKEVNKGQDAERYKGFGRRKIKEDVEDSPLVDVPARAEPSVLSPADELMASLAGLDLDLSLPAGGTAQADAASTPTPAPPPPTSSAPVHVPKAVTSSANPTGRKMSTPLTHGADKWLTRHVYNHEGVLYEDGQLQVGIKSEFHGHLGRVALFFGNKISVPLDSFTVTVDVDDPDALSVTLPQIPAPTLHAMSQMQQLVHVECKDIFSLPPLLNISYLAGSLQTITLRLPIFLTKFIEPVQLGQNDFFERWKQIGGPPREAQKIFPIKVDNGKVDTAKNRKVVDGTCFGLLDGIDPNPNNIVAAGVLHMSTAGKVGCLLRLEPNTDAKLCRLTIRSTNDAVSAETLKTLVDLRLTLELAHVLDFGEIPVRIDQVVDLAALTPEEPRSRRAVHLPQECVDAILIQVSKQFWEGSVDETSLAELRRLALVSRIWAKAARRMLYSSIQGLVSTGALMRLRGVLAASPELMRVVKKIDLSAPSCRWESSQVSEFFRRAAGLLRDTPLVQDIQLLHIGLSDVVRRKLWGAMAELPIQQASLDSSCWSSNNGHRAPATTSSTTDMGALMLALTRWTSLRVLSLHAYNLSPRVFETSAAPSHAFPAYRLTSLDISSCELDGASLLWLLGRSAKTIKQLNLTNVTGITLDEVEDVLRAVGPSLVELQLSLDSDDFAESNPPRANVDAKAFAGLAQLTTLVVATDMDTKALLDQFALLPRLTFLGFNCPSLPFPRVKRFLEMNPEKLKDLNLDLWGEDESWTCYTRFLAARECAKRGIDILIDGSDREELENAWFGMDLAKCWTFLEEEEWPVPRETEPMPSR
ncbi:hypothetical protein RQP46_008361 [Phenoliferia psychrophenolica]